MPNGKVQRYFRHGTLTQLRVFEAVARHCNFTRAAEELHMAQPTVSVQIKKLTDTIGTSLLEQWGKRIRLTPAGLEVQAACQRMFETFGGLDESLANLRGLKTGKLRIATTASGEYLLPLLLAQFLKLHAGIEVSLHVARRASVLERLAQDADDLYLLTRPPDTGTVAARPLMPNPLVALAPADHPLARKKNIPFATFAREPLLVREPGSGTRLAVDQAFSEHNLHPNVSMEAGSNETIKEAIIAGLGVSLLYRCSLGYDIDARRLTMLDVDGIPKDSAWHFVHPAARPLPCIAQTFLDFAAEHGRRIFDEHAAQRTKPARPRLSRAT